MVDPTMMAIFWLLLRPLVGLEGVGGVDDGVGVEVMALEIAIGEDVVGAVVGVETAERRGMCVVVLEDAEGLDVLNIDAVGLAVVGFDVALVAAASSPSWGLVHRTGFCPTSSTMLNSLLMNVGGVALEVLRSDTSKWHTQAFPSSRGTRAEPVAETDWLYAGR